ncbi:fungal-specific transcription factor domain-containing protein [Glomus cerebriforme]|uniref:Fungal-specific transcription factor domain-containing protein n=1 Tax=Glomus cerebriforme TaxID=658196 RepID=A0A397SJF8_9GLOM|nr:fungal-specific transcription factor domain-containing protein [Glomus cerebriforme]
MDPPTFITSDIATDNLAPTSNLESQTIRRKRLTQACDACRKKKVKCSGDKPSCNNCTRLGLTCTYLPSTRKRGPRVGLVESLEKRLQQMEKLLQPLKEQGIVDDAEDKKPVKKPRLSKNSETNSHISANPYTPNVFNNSPQQSFGQTEFINTFSRTPLVEQQSQQEQTSNADRSDNITSEEEEGTDLLFFGKSSANPGFHNQREAFVHCDRDPPIKSEPSEINEQSSPSDSNHSAEEIPIISPITDIVSQSDIILDLVSCYFRYLDIQITMFHEATFMKQLRQEKVSKFLIYAMCAVSARYSEHPSIIQKIPYMAGQHFAAIALNNYLFDTFDSPTIEHVQGLILITIHMYGIGKGPRAWMFTGMAVRMAQELGLHKIDEAAFKLKTEGQFIQREIKRRTWWSCFRLDRFAACALGRPTLIDEDDCDVRLPCSESIWNLEHPFESPLIDEIFKEEQVKHGTRLPLTNIGLGACLVSVTALLGRVCQHVNRSRPFGALPPWDENSQFVVLENELESWYKSLTPHYTYTKERMHQLMADGVGTTFALVHLLYYSAVVVLNRPNIAPLQNDEVVDRYVNFMHASVKRCCAAAKLISSIAEDINQFGGQHMCPFSMYPVFVTTSIHLNNTYSSDINIAEDAKKNLFINERFLKLLGPYWAMASKLLGIVEEMMRNTQADNERDVSFNTDAGLKNDWNRVNNNNSLIESTNLDNVSSIIIPEQLLSPRWFNDTTFMGDSWTSFLRSPGPFSPSLLRLMKKENDNSNQDNSYDYFSQDLTAYNSIQAPSALVYNGYPMIDISSDWSTTAGSRVFPLNRPIKHWTNINGNIINSEIEDTHISATTFTPTSSTSDINIDPLLI